MTSSWCIMYNLLTRYIDIMCLFRFYPNGHYSGKIMSKSLFFYSLHKNLITVDLWNLQESINLWQLTLIHFGYIRLQSSLFFSLRNKVLPLMTEVTFEVTFRVEIHFVSVFWLILIVGWLILMQVWTLISLKSMLFSKLSPIWNLG